MRRSPYPKLTDAQEYRMGLRLRRPARLRYRDPRQERLIRRRERRTDAAETKKAG